MRDQLQLYADVCARQSHSVGEHVGKRRDDLSLCAGKKSLGFDIPHPNQIGQPRFYVQIVVQLGFGNHESEQKPQIYDARDKPK